MESTETFMGIFKNSWENNNVEALARVFKEAPDFLQNIPKSDIERALETIFDEQKGLFKFIKTILSMQKNQMTYFKMPLKEVFSLVQFIMEIFHEKYESYIMQTWEIGFYCVKTSCWFYARKTASEALKKLIELFATSEQLVLPLNQIIEYYNDNYLRLFSRKEGCIFYIVLGAIFRHCPKMENVQKFADKLFLNLLEDIKNQIQDDSEKQPEEIKIYIECYLDILTNFVPFEEDEKQSLYFEKLYSYLSILCKPNRSQKTLRNRVVYFITVHEKHFASFIFYDYEKWHKLFNDILDETENVSTVQTLRIFYRTIALHLLKGNYENIFMYFKNYFMLNLSNRDATSYRSRLIINGLGEFSVAYAKYSIHEIYDIFQMISVRTLPFYAKENGIDENFDAIVDYLQALSQILRQLPNVSFHHVNIVMELSILFAKRFPELKEEKKKDAINILITTFINMSHLENNLQNEYFHSFVREGILWSCSHALYIDVEFQKNSLENVPERIFTYKDYLPLWQSILTINHQKEYSNIIVLQIFDVFISVLISSIEKLNLNIKAQENNIFSDMSFSFKAEKETDFRFFINLIDLCVETFEEVDAFLLQNWIENLFVYFIKISYKKPWISGFYKMIEVILKKLYFLSIDEEVALNKATFDLIFQYLLDVIQLAYKFTGELQLSCIYLILNAPIVFVKNLIDEMIPIFKIIFNIGLTDLTVASFALDTLENWIGNSNVKCSKDFLKAIVSFVDPYLSSEESKIDQVQASIVRRKKKNEKLAEFSESDESLEALQKRILLFYGLLDLSALFEFVHEKSIATDAAWNKKDLVQCELLFPGNRLEMHLDKFIPRILELTSSGDRRLKLSACELFHTVVTMILGKKLMDQCFDKSLYSSLLRLSCDSDDTVRNLYHPFLIQLTHYLSSNASRTPQDFVDSLFEGMCDKFNTSLRDHCALYLKEFITWSSQHSMDENDPMTVLDVNIKSVIRRIINFALYPSNEKRLAAAIAFDHLYPIFQSSTTILNTYWLEFFYVFVKCLEECDDAKIGSALDRIVNLIETKSDLFNATSRGRRVPTAFGDGTLNNVLIWLFNQCTSRNLNCRRKCMEMFEKLLPLSSAPDTVKSLLANKTGAILLKSLRDENFTLTVKNVKNFVTILDVYIWILEKKFIPFENFFMEQEDGNIFSKCFSDFISAIVTKHEAISAADGEITITKLEELENLTCQGILKILEFVTTMIKESKDSMEELHWDDSLYLLIAYCTLFPNKVGITPEKLQVNEELPCQLHDLLLMMKSSFSESDIIKFQEKVFAEANVTVSQFTDIQSIIRDKSNIQEFKQLLKGLSILQKSNIFDFEKEFQFTQIYLEDLINRIFTALRIEVMNYDSCKKIEEDTKEYFIEMLTFFLEKYETDIVELLVKLINTDAQLASLNGSTIMHGEYFIELFKVPVFKYMLNDPAETMKILDNYFDQSPDKVLKLIEDLLTFSHHQKEKIERKEILADGVIERFSALQRLINDDEYRRKTFLNIYRLAVSLKAKPTEAMKTNGLPNELYTWVLGELLRSKSLDHKTLFLRYFLIALADENSGEVNPELSIVFQELRDYDGNAWLEKLKSDEVVRFQAATCFQVLLKMLVATKSLLVFQAVIKFSAGVYKYMNSENVSEYLSCYFNSISDSNAQNSLHLAYKIFWDLNSFGERLDVLKVFLLPSIEASKSDIVDLFYDKHFQEMALCIKKEIDCGTSSRVSDRVKLIVSKTGCYSLFELLYVKSQRKHNFEDPESKSQKPLNQFLVQQAMHVRSYSAKSQEEKEPARLLHCAALNCCISLISLKSEENFYKFIFFEDRKKDQLIWERIVDCEREYRLEQAPTSFRKERKKLINIRSSSTPAGNSSASYFRRYDLTSLTLLEDVHAYDLNNIRVMSQARAAVDQGQRLNLGFEDDPLNEHECMPMLCGVLIHMFNSGISELPSDERPSTADDLPLFLRLLRNAFAIQQPNVQLFLFRLLANTSQAFLPYMPKFFAAIAGSLCFYLTSRPLNCLIRDALLLLIESNYSPENEQDRRPAQRLLQRLVERVPAGGPAERRYNLELLEAIWSKWSSALEWPAIPEDDTLEPEVLTRLVLAGLRAGGRRTDELDARLLPFVRYRLENWRDDESSVIAAFEAMGFLLRDAGEERCREEADRLVNLMTQMEKRSRERCAQCVCALYRASGSEVLLKPLLRFVEARRLAAGQRVACLRLLADRLAGPGREEAATPAGLLRLGLDAALAERWPGCEGPALQALQRILPLLGEKELRPLLKQAAGLAAPSSLCLLEHRRQALELLSEAWKILPSGSPSVGLCAAALLSALQPGEPTEVQDLALAAWRERLPESRSANARLLGFLSSLRGHGVARGGSAAARLLCLLLLELAAESPGAARPMFRPLLEGLNFREYQPLATYRAPSLGSMAPLFAPSLAASWTEASRMGSLEMASFQASAQPTQSGFRIPEPSQNRLSLRKPSAPQVVQRRRDYQMQLRKERELARRNVRLYRKYRLGDLPDVEITYSSFVESLRQFILRDWLACRDLAVELIYQLIENSRGGVDHETLLSSISAALESLPEDPDAQDEFGLILLQVGLRCKTISLDAITAARLCRSSGFNSLGILLLEEKLLSEDDNSSTDVLSQVRKRMRLSEPSDQQIWMQLVELQKALGETDIVTGVLCREDLFSSSLKQAAKAQAARKWLEATNIYEQGYEISLGSEKDHCLEGMFECMSELSSWDSINRKIDNILSSNYDRIWEEKGKYQRLLPWLLEAQLQQTLEEFTSNKDLTNVEFQSQFDSWIRKGQSSVKRPYGEHLSVFYLSSRKNQLAGQCLKNSVDHWKEQWIRLSPLSEKLKMQILTRLRSLQNINAYLQAVKSTDIQNATAKLIRYWDQHLPSEKQDLLSWNKLVYYRLTFAHLLHEQITNIFDDDDPLLKELFACCARQRMKISESAMLQENKTVTRKHTQQIERILQQYGDDYGDLNHEFHLLASKYKLISSQAESNIKKKFKYFLASWDITESLINDENVENSLKMKAHHHLFDITERLKVNVEGNEEFRSVVANDQNIIDKLEMEEEQNLIDALRHYGFNSLKSACELMSDGNDHQLAESYTKFGKYCYSLLRHFRADSTICTNFISSILSGMSFGSLEATQYFPSLLKYEYYRDNEEAKQVFISKSEQVQSWLFISWQAQILSNLTKPIGQLLIPIVKRLICDYPNAIIYNFHQTYEASPQMREMPEVRSMYEILFRDTKIKTFFEAMHCVCQPEHYLRYHLVELLDSKTVSPQLVDNILKKAFPSESGKKALQGPLFKELEKYRAELVNIKQLDFETAKVSLQQMAIKLLEGMKMRIKDFKKRGLQLKDYSPYLNDFTGEEIDIEIPGQYRGMSKPILRYHTKISKFDRFVTVMESKCNPVKINIIGNDAKIYGFLVKFGEDLRQDQRLQQTFNLMNKILEQDKNCSERYLFINTYHVVPLSTSLGLIQWIDETKTLREFIEFSMDDKTLIETVCLKYKNWIEAAGKSDFKANSYKKAIVKYSPKDVNCKMKEFIKSLNWDSLRKTFFMLSSSLDCFVSLRQNFTKSYATMCIIHWITGIGDRHLENMLIEVKTANCYGIDFGSAFGIGIDQSVPELVPFRLTPQILGLLQPYGEQGLFAVTMTRVLTALQNKRTSILACLDIFVHEPLDWSKYTRKQMDDTIGENKDVIKWLPKKKIAFVEKKLSGGKPSAIMLEELSNVHDDEDNDDENQYFSKYKLIINGTDSNQISNRSKLNNELLTSEEQVQCLLEQAKDLNVLGRMFYGWCPFA